MDGFRWDIREHSSSIPKQHFPFHVVPPPLLQASPYVPIVRHGGYSEWVHCNFGPSLSGC